MAHTNQARKRIRQAEKARLHNREVKADLRTHIKNYRVAVKSGDDKTAELLSTVESKLDKVAKRNILPTPRVNRMKSRLKMLSTAKK